MKREETLVNCIDDVQSGRRRLEECMAEHPDIATELSEIIRIMRDIDAETVVPTPEFKQLTRARLIREIASTRIDRRAETRRRFRPWRLAFAPIAAVILLAIGSGGAAFASQNSLPGDVLYPVKTGVEKLQVALQFSPESRANLHLTLAERRVQEAEEESSLGRDIQASALSTVASQIDGLFRDMAGVPDDAASSLLNRVSDSTAEQQTVLEQVSQTAGEAARPAIEQAIGAARRGNIIARVAAGNRSLLGTGISVTDDELDSSYFEIEGNVVSVQGQAWNVGGISLTNVKTTDQAPAVGNNIKLCGLYLDDETYVGKVEPGQAGPDQSSITGVYTGRDDAGRWSISGIPVGGSENVTPPPEGDRVEVKGTLKDGVFDIDHEGSDTESAAEDSRQEIDSGDETSGGQPRTSPVPEATPPLAQPTTTVENEAPAGSQETSTAGEGEYDRVNTSQEQGGYDPSGSSGQTTTDNQSRTSGDSEEPEHGD